MWSKVVGHKRQIDQIKRTLASKRIPNAYLFHGPNGVGKRLIANALSQAMACERTETVGFNACGECAACRKTAAGNHPDRGHSVEDVGGQAESLDLVAVCVL